ncbi:reverse transcriptase [Gossypium australe]|uniref:Reverse transcriptase n=1 Tax=Gossypium australe TaxID=47621 RepID=A0A5B6VZT9_9ROSI|nr:reverse transcriptase [Gossypium australe]
MEAFRNALEDCRLSDVGGNLPETNIPERVDRGVANENWRSMFPEATIQHLPHSISDHCPLLISTRKEDAWRSKKTFKFEAWWVLEESFEAEVKAIWESSSAYDRVEWSCLKEIMGKMGFDPNWISSIMNCISIVSYSVILNGQIGDTFHPSIGLRQGDPLSPFLFLICGEGLSSLMRKATNEGLLKGVKVSRRGPQISYLLFADDCILFGEANERGAGFFKKILREYGNCTGQ